MPRSDLLAEATIIMAYKSYGWPPATGDVEQRAVVGGEMVTNWQRRRPSERQAASTSSNRDAYRKWPREAVADDGETPAELAEPAMLVEASGCPSQAETLARLAILSGYREAIFSSLTVEIACAKIECSHIEAQK